LARALDLHSRGQGFDSLILHPRTPKPWRRGTVTRERLKKVGSLSLLLHSEITKERHKASVNKESVAALKNGNSPAPRLRRIKSVQKEIEILNKQDKFI
jgi:hypothetical protein